MKNQIKSEEENARELLEKIEAEKLKKATDAFNLFLKAWSEEHGCGLLPVGEFQGNKIKTAIKVLIIKK